MHQENIDSILYYGLSSVSLPQIKDGDTVTPCNNAVAAFNSKVNS